MPYFKVLLLRGRQAIRRRMMKLKKETWSGSIEVDEVSFWNRIVRRIVHIRGKE
ncbi:MAG: hypothetical protein ACI35J_00325 [Peribacillus sp.]